MKTLEKLYALQDRRDDANERKLVARLAFESAELRFQNGENSRADLDEAKRVYQNAIVLANVYQNEIAALKAEMAERATAKRPSAKCADCHEPEFASKLNGGRCTVCLHARARKGERNAAILLKQILTAR